MPGYRVPRWSCKASRFCLVVCCVCCGCVCCGFFQMYSMKMQQKFNFIFHYDQAMGIEWMTMSMFALPHADVELDMGMSVCGCVCGCWCVAHVHVDIDGVVKSVEN